MSELPLSARELTVFLALDESHPHSNLCCLFFSNRRCDSHFRPQRKTPIAASPASIREEEDTVLFPAPATGYEGEEVVGRRPAKPTIPPSPASPSPFPAASPIRIAVASPASSLPAQPANQLPATGYEEEDVVESPLPLPLPPAEEDSHRQRPASVRRGRKRGPDRLAAEPATDHLQLRRTSSRPVVASPTGEPAPASSSPAKPVTSSSSGNLLRGRRRDRASSAQEDASAVSSCHNRLRGRRSRRASSS